MNPLIQDWIERGFKWKYVWQPTYRPLTVPAKGQIQIPRGDFSYKAPEGILLTFAALFDNPHCGIRMNNPQLDTLGSFTVNNIAILGTYSQPWFVVSNMPPQTVDGTYNILQYKAWPWTDYCELYVINQDTVDHVCYGFAYTMALLLQERTPDATETSLLAMLANSLYPVEAELKKKIPRNKVDEWLATVKTGNIYNARYEREGK